MLFLVHALCGIGIPCRGQARLDAARCPAPLICRGIERQAIVRDDVERVETGKMDASVILTFVVSEPQPCVSSSGAVTGSTDIAFISALRA